MLERFLYFFSNFASNLIYGFINIKEAIAELCGYRCKFIAADVEGYIDFSYLLNNIPYRIRFKRKFGPPAYTRIEKKDGESVTIYVAQFAGPCRNFYGIPTTPRILGFESLKVFFRTGNSETFLENDLIILEK